MPHIHDQIDFTVGAYIIYQDKVLLVNHLQLKKWLCPGGHIELDEDPEQALFREIEEETGIKKEDLVVLSEKFPPTDPDSNPLYKPNYLDIHKISATHRHVGMGYYLISKTDQVKLAQREHSGIRWFSEEDLEDPQFALHEDVKLYCRQALKAARNYSQG